MEKEMEKDQNIIIMVIKNLLENIKMEKDGMEMDMIGIIMLYMKQKKEKDLSRNILI